MRPRRGRSTSRRPRGPARAAWPSSATGPTARSSGAASTDPIADEREALEELEQVLATAIRGQSMADVPVGAFLSGGIDSSTICGLYQKYSSVPVRTFSIGFEEAGYDEAKAAKRVAQHLGTVHDERYVTVREARDVIPLLPGMYDEPFADSSQIPTHLVSRFAREQVTVALTGDGGDELFAGYNRHFAAPRLWRQLQKVPQPLRAATGSPLSRVPSHFWSGMADLFPAGASRTSAASCRRHSASPPRPAVSTRSIAASSTSGARSRPR